MSWLLWKKPIEFSSDKASQIINRMIRRYNQVDQKETGDLAVRILTSIKSFFSVLRRSSVTEDMKVSRLEGPSSEKTNRLFQSVVEDLDVSYTQQNAIDVAVVENHNLIDTQQNKIRAALKIANDRLSELDTVTTESVDSAILVFEDNFDTLQKTDLITPLNHPRADVDTIIGVVRLKNEGTVISHTGVEEFTAVARFDGTTLGTGTEIGNMYSDGKLYGEPRESGESGIRYGFSAIIEGSFTTPGVTPADLPDPGGGGDGTIDPGEGGGGPTTDPDDDPSVIDPDNPLPWVPGKPVVPIDVPPAVVAPAGKASLEEPADTPTTDPSGDQPDDIEVPVDPITPPYMPDPIFLPGENGIDPRKDRQVPDTDGSDKWVDLAEEKASKQDFNLFKREP